MVKRYTEEEAKEFIATGMMINEYSCPECGFSFNAQHVCDDKERGYTCPLCEAAEYHREISQLKEEVQFYKDQYRFSEKQRTDWITKYNDESIQKTKYRCAFEALFEKISQK